jgi:GT2 family glycosyltransferase
VEFFGENLGHGGAQNRLADAALTDLILVANPDVIPTARALSILASTLGDASVGIAEAKQLPLEHPKDYDRATGATSWCSGAFSMMRAEVFRAVGGFDHETFFMYCDDVDLSWRIRATGRAAIMQPAAVVHHDKRLSASGSWIPTGSERYYSAEAALLLAHKWSRPDIVESIAAAFSAGDDPIEHSALAELRRREAGGLLPAPLDREHRTADFGDGTYGTHRFSL